MIHRIFKSLFGCFFPHCTLIAHRHKGYKMHVSIAYNSINSVFFDVIKQKVKIEKCVFGIFIRAWKLYFAINEQCGTRLKYKIRFMYVLNIFCKQFLSCNRNKQWFRKKRVRRGNKKRTKKNKLYYTDTRSTNTNVYYKWKKTLVVVIQCWNLCRSLWSVDAFSFFNKYSILSLIINAICTAHTTELLKDELNNIYHLAKKNIRKNIIMCVVNT